MDFTYLIRFDYIEFALAMVFIVALERLIHIRERLLRHPRFYGWASLAITALMTIIVFGHADFSQGLIMARILNGHLISWVSIFLIFYTFGYGDIIQGIFVTGEFAAVHEFISIAGVFASGQIFNQYINGQLIPPEIIVAYYITFFLFLGGITLAYIMFTKCKYNKVMLKTMIIMIVFTALVVTIGDNATVNIGGATSWYLNLDVNLTEQLSWITPAIYLIVEGLTQILSTRAK